MCSVNVDGAAAAVLASGKKVRELGLGKRAVKVRFRPLRSLARTDLIMPDVNSCTRLAAEKPSPRGTGPGGSDLRGEARLLRNRRATALRERLVRRRRSRAFIDDGETALGGRTPVSIPGAPV